MTDIKSYRRVVDAAAFHRLVGITLERADLDGGIAVLRLCYQSALSIFPDSGNYHGGVIATLVDVAGSVVCGLAAGRPAPTANVRIDYLTSPVKTDLIATGRLVRAGDPI
ncbi:PaaI family thioesterase [Rhodopseudomonas sp. HC1]|uniref:PaaI family thioesterase n=1 Tax=Rhodopseudomonas infernalis TaxID=2897386 RepID=UPI001EE8D826|nr:PaaI family thioesterase [Rhodopseudomonas infernalis]MCG6203761.1 PaaI family thioesterase [Rhodopseudomonas infernalis]